MSREERKQALRDFSVLVVAVCVLYFLIHGLAQAEPDTTTPVMLFLADNHGKMGVIVTEVINGHEYVFCMGSYEALPKIVCATASGEPSRIPGMLLVDMVPAQLPPLGVSL